MCSYNSNDLGEWFSMLLDLYILSNTASLEKRTGPNSNTLSSFDFWNTIFSFDENETSREHYCTKKELDQKLQNKGSFLLKLAPWNSSLLSMFT